MELRSARAVARVFPRDGGRLGQLEVDGVALLRGPEDAHLGWGWWGSYPLLPWSNRIPNGTIPFLGKNLRVPVNWEDGSALHGLAAERPWSVMDLEESAPDRAVSLRIALSVGCYEIIGEQTFRLFDDHLAQTLAVTNVGDVAVPVGLGIHPWFVGGPVRIPADRMWPGDGPMPTGPPVAVDAAADLRILRVPPVMDRCYTGLTNNVADVPGLRLQWDGPVTQVVVFSGSPGWVCVEPVTMANNGFALASGGQPDTGVIVLEPGRSARVRYRFCW